MIPKEKALDLVNKFTWQRDEHEKYVAKEIANTCVDEILKSFDGFMDSRKNFRHELEIDTERYWVAVKAELERL